MTLLIPGSQNIKGVFTPLSQEDLTVETEGEPGNTSGEQCQMEAGRRAVDPGLAVSQ